MDSGSQINLISHTLLPFLKYTPCLSPIRSVRGVGSANRINRWIKLQVTLDNGALVETKCAVVTDLSCGALFGLPFLHEIKAIHDISNMILQTSQGPIVLRTPASTLTPSSYSVIANASIDINFADSTLTDDQKEQVRSLMLEYDDLWRDGRRGKAAHVEHRIRLLTDRPIVARPRQITEEQRRIIAEEVNKMLKEEVIRPSNSSYASEIVLAMKKTGDWRFCIDFRALNKATVKDKYPLPRIHDLIHAIKGSKYFVALDLRSGYWQVPLETHSIKYTAFRCFLGLYEFIRMPFGLTNAPATFQRMMDFIFGDLRFQGVLAYIDDILVHSPTFQRTLQLLRKVLERLRVNQITLNLPKSLFFPRKLKYLGQIVIDGQLHPDPKKIEALRHIQPPTNLNEVRSLLGFLGFYHSFIPNYSDLLAPIFELLRDQKNTKRKNKSTAVNWTSTHQAAVEEAIDRLSKTVLEIPSDSDEFMVETDASGRAVAAVLHIKQGDSWKPVEFYSKSLSKTQQNWPAREREAYAIVIALLKFDCYLRGRSFTVHTDHESLKWMLDCPRGKIARWAGLMAEYDLSIYHRKGKELIHIDFLSRFIDNEYDETLTDRMCFFTSVAPIPSIEQIIATQRIEAPPTSAGFSRTDDIIYYHGLIYVPPSLRNKVIAACHSTAPFHHPGVKKTKATIMKIFNWPHLHQDVAEYLQSCLYCKRCRSGRERLQGHFLTHPIPGAFDTVYMDFWQCHYDDRNYIMLTMIDQCTKWAECITITTKDADKVAATFLRSWVYRFGLPRKIVSDRDRSFMNKFTAPLTAKLGIKHIPSTAYHPEGNAVIESFHRTLSSGLRHFDHSKIPFEEAVDLVLFGYRATIHSTTNQSPSYLTHGVDPRLAADCDWRMEPHPTNQERLKFLSTLRLDVQLQAHEALKRQNARRNKSRQPMEFKEGQLVLSRAMTLEQLDYKTAYYKAAPRWSLPYRVISVRPSKKTATIQSLLTHKTKEIHIQDAQFIDPPKGAVQRQEWFDLVNSEAKTMFDPTTCRTVVEEFFEAIDYPQAPLPTKSRKRARTAKSEGP